MRNITTTIAGIVIGAVATTGAYAYGAGHAPVVNAATHQRVDIPRWVVKPCAGPYRVNCRWTPSEKFINNHPLADDLDHVSLRREMPTGNHMVCVFFAQHAYARQHDYCS